MLVVRDCPEIECWPALLNDTVPATERENYERHLESCSVCQERLRRIEGDEDGLRRLGRRIGDPTAVTADPLLVQVLGRLHGAKPPARLAPLEAADLYFLRPSDEPGVLGTLGDYEVREVIGQGGMGLVLLAFEPVLHRLVAIKVMASALAGSATARRRFTREAQAAAAVCHDHIVAVHSVDTIDGLPYLVMQYVAGESLQDRLDRTGPLEVTEIVRIGLQTAMGLAAAHAQGLIHRDIKPANLLLENGGDRVKITDFGLARMADDVGLTQDGVVAGTPEYMAPEQARGEVVDQRADLFSLGCVLYACCTGVPPFRSSTALAVLRQLSDEDPRPVRALNADAPVWLEAVVMRLLAKDPTERFQSAAEVAVLLEGYLAHLHQPATVPVPKLPLSPLTESRGPSFPGSRTGSVKRFLQYVGLPALVGLAVLGLSLFFLAQVVPPEQPPPEPEPAMRQFYQDFRGEKPLHPSLELEGPEDASEVSKHEAEGLRITLPATRRVNQPVEVVTSFALSGDFEVTGTYELLSATRPAKGYGVGVTLNIADSKARTKFAKIARTMLPRQGSVFQSEYWVNKPSDYQGRTKPTVSRIGQLRLVRKGPVLRCLAANGLKGDFQEIFSQDHFGTEDMGHVLLGVMDSGSPGNAVDARLVDFKIRATNLIPDPGDTNFNPSSAPAGGPQHKSGSKKWLAALGIMGLLILSSLGIFLAVRRLRRSGDSSSPAPVSEEEVRVKPAAPSISLRCSGCEKALKVKPELAGKKVKCPQCDQTIVVPSLKTNNSGGTAG